MKAIIGKKLGMTQVFGEAGRMIPVTVIAVEPGCVIQVKTRATDGYECIKVGFFEALKPSRINKPMTGVFKKAGQKVYKMLKELKMDGYKVGDAVSADIFAKGDSVKVKGVSIGKGFQGVVKRHKFAGGPASHGSMFYRAPGSIGASSYPSRVWKNKKLPGHMGDVTVTVSNLKVVEVRENLILVRGAVPGAKNAVVEITKEG